MSQKTSHFLQKISKGKTRKLLLTSIEQLIKNIEAKEIILELKQKHQLHKLQKAAYFNEIKEKIRQIYGEDFSLSLRLKPIKTHHDREMNIPHAIHY